MTRAAARNGRANGGGQIVAHGGGAGIRDQPLAAFESHRLERHDAGGRIAADDDVVLRSIARAAR